MQFFQVNEEHLLLGSIMFMLNHNMDGTLS
jgi:hypothetical protein